MGCVVFAACGRFLKRDLMEGQQDSVECLSDRQGWCSGQRMQCFWVLLEAAHDEEAVFSVV